MMHYGPRTRAKRSEASPKGTNPEKGVILLVVLMVIIVVSIYLPAYVTWGIWDQRNLIRQQRAEEAKAIAQAGLDRAVLDLYMETGSWLGDEINGNTLIETGGPDPDPAKRNNFYTLYTGNLTNGSYTVQIRYLYDAGNFLDKRMWVKSTGTTTGANVTLEQMVDYFAVRNLTQNPDILYTNLQPAIDEAVTGGWNNNVFAITAATLAENIAINSALNFNIQGCYDPNFTFPFPRSCMDYPTRIQGNVNISGNATVNLTGVTID